MHDDTLSPLEKNFWHQFDAAARAAGDLSAAESSRLTREAIDHHVAESTIRGWLAHKRLPRDDEGFLAVIKVFQAEQQLDWLPLLHAAQKSRVARNGSVADLEPPVLPGDGKPSQPPRSTKRLQFLLAGSGAITVLAIFVMLALSADTSSSNNSNEATSESNEWRATPESSEQLCAKVISPVAQVFPEPGAEPYNKIAKYRGDQLVLYPDVSDASGPDGRLYRAVRSPARANPGTSPYSWMLADDIINASCGHPR